MNQDYAATKSHWLDIFSMLIRSPNLLVYRSSIKARTSYSLFGTGKFYSVGLKAPIKQLWLKEHCFYIHRYIGYFIYKCNITGIVTWQIKLIEDLMKAWNIPRFGVTGNPPSESAQCSVSRSGLLKCPATIRHPTADNRPLSVNMFI